MTRDYASRSRSRRKPAQPPWAWIILGLLIGLFVAFLVYINSFETPASGDGPSAPVSKPRPTPAEQKPPEPVEVEKDEKVHFDFYKILPQYEVVIPEEDLQKPELKETPPGKYMLQAGSFSKADDADTRRAELALLGLVARIQTVTINGNDWHRVQLGPYDDMKKLDQARKLLQTGDIEFLLLRTKE